MTQARCFNCEIKLERFRKPMEELVQDKLPLFCSQECAYSFPDKGTKEFKEKLNYWRKKLNENQ